VYFLLLFHKSVVLCNTTQSKLIHEVDFIRVVHVLVGEVLDGNGECRAEKHDLAVFRVELQQLFDDWCEFG